MQNADDAKNQDASGGCRNEVSSALFGPRQLNSEAHSKQEGEQRVELVVDKKDDERLHERSSAAVGNCACRASVSTTSVVIHTRLASSTPYSAKPRTTSMRSMRSSPETGWSAGAVKVYVRHVLGFGRLRVSDASRLDIREETVQIARGGKPWAERRTWGTAVLNARLFIGRRCIAAYSSARCGAPVNWS